MALLETLKKNLYDDWRVYICLYIILVVVYSLGNNAFGQCGRTVIPDENYQASRMVHSIPRDDVIKVVCGHDHTLLLTNQGKVFSAGLGTDGQTGMYVFS